MRDNSSDGGGGSSSQTSKNIIYKVWQPGQRPQTHEPLLSLHSPDAMRFFVESMTHGNSVFASRAFHMVAYWIRNQLIETQIASGVFQIFALGGHIFCQVVREDGEMISAKIKQVCADASDHETQLL